MLHDAIATYHDLLTGDLAAASQERLEAEQARRGLTFGGRPVCTVLRPRFLTAEQYRFLRRRVALLMQAFAVLQARVETDERFRRQFCLSAEEEELFGIDPGFPWAMPTSRLDAFFTPDSAGGGELLFTEFNAETPAAQAYSDELAEVFDTLPVMAEFRRHYHAYVPPARPGAYHALRESFARWRGRREPPRIAILDWKEVPTYPEFLLFQDYFRRQGLACEIVDPREVEYDGKRLTAGDFPVTLIYKRVLISELVAWGGMDQPVIRAVRDGAVCMVNPFRCKPLYKKASLAVLSDEANAGLFSPAQREAIAAHVPWTRLVEERRTRFDGSPVDLVPFVLANRERLVLKPNDDYGGKGIVLGWTVDPSAWQQAVAAALQSPHVVQDRIRLPSEPFPALGNGKLHVGERMLDTAPFVTMGEYVDGCLTRIATDPLLNVSAGGGSTVPTFVIEPR